MVSPPASRPVFIGISHKMYLSQQATDNWMISAAALLAQHPALTENLVRVVVLPGFLSLNSAVQVLGNVGIGVGAQDLHYQDRGAFTGEVSGADLIAIGCTHVEIGHAERRQMFGETDQIIRLKLAAALRNRLIPILCFGETRQASTQIARSECLTQLEAALGSLIDEPHVLPLVLAYEPVWAIGQAKAADPDHVRAISRCIRDWLNCRPNLADARLIYGGSAGPGTLAALHGAVDGLFLGRFAHDLNALSSILDEAVALCAPSTLQADQ